MGRLFLFFCTAFLFCSFNLSFSQSSDPQEYKFEVEVEHGYYTIDVKVYLDTIYDKYFPCGEFFEEHNATQIKWGTFEAKELYRFIEHFRASDFNLTNLNFGINTLALPKDPDKPIDLSEPDIPEAFQDHFYDFLVEMGDQVKGPKAASGLFFWEEREAYYKEFQLTDFISPNEKTGFIPYYIDRFAYRFLVLQERREFEITFHPVERKSFQFITNADKKKYQKHIQKVLDSDWGFSYPYFREKVTQGSFIPLARFWEYDPSDYEGIAPTDWLFEKFDPDNEEGLSWRWPYPMQDKQPKIFKFTAYGPLSYKYGEEEPCCLFGFSSENPEFELILPPGFGEEKEHVRPRLIEPTWEGEPEPIPIPRLRRSGPGGYGLGDSPDTVHPSEPDWDELPIPKGETPSPQSSLPNDYPPGEDLEIVYFSTSSNDVPTGPIGDYVMEIYTSNINDLPDQITLSVPPAYLHSTVATQVNEKGKIVDIKSQPNYAYPTCADVVIRDSPSQKTDAPTPMVIKVTIPIQGICIGTPYQLTVPKGQPWGKVTFVPSTPTANRIRTIPKDQRTTKQQDILKADDTYQLITTVNVTKQQLTQEGVITHKMEGYQNDDNTLIDQYVAWDIQMEPGGITGTWSDEVHIAPVFDSIFVADIETAAETEMENLPEAYQQEFAKDQEAFKYNIAQIKGRMKVTKGIPEDTPDETGQTLPQPFFFELQSPTELGDLGIVCGEWMATENWETVQVAVADNFEDNRYFVFFSPFEDDEGLYPLNIENTPFHLTHILRTDRPEPNGSTWIDMGFGNLVEEELGGGPNEIEKGICGAISTLHSFDRLRIPHDLTNKKTPPYFQNGAMNVVWLKLLMGDRPLMNTDRIQAVHKSHGFSNCVKSDKEGPNGLPAWAKELHQKVKASDRKGPLWDCTLYTKFRDSEGNAKEVGHFEHIQDMSLSETKRGDELVIEATITTANALEQKPPIWANSGRNVWHLSNQQKVMKKDDLVNGEQIATPGDEVRMPHFYMTSTNPKSAQYQYYLNNGVVIKSDQAQQLQEGGLEEFCEQLNLNPKNRLYVSHVAYVCCQRDPSTQVASRQRPQQFKDNKQPKEDQAGQAKPAGPDLAALLAKVQEKYLKWNDAQAAYQKAKDEFVTHKLPTESNSQHSARLRKTSQKFLKLQQEESKALSHLRVSIFRALEAGAEIVDIKAKAPDFDLDKWK